MTQNERRHFLVTRTDRAGDLILTMPIFRELKKAWPNSSITALVTKYTHSLLKLCKEVDNVLLVKEGNFSSVIKQAREIRKFKINEAFIVYPDLKVMLSVWLAGVKSVTGRASNVWQFLLTNRKVQRRSRNVRHEFEYNLDLLDDIIFELDYSGYKFSCSDSEIKQGMIMLKRMGFNYNRPPVIVHPGDGGSSKNLSVNQYITISRALLSEGLVVAISIGPGEEAVADVFRKNISHPNLFFIQGIKDWEKLAFVFANCSTFVGGSTGPLHLAAALGLNCAAFYPPVKAMTPERWGPLAPKKLVITPYDGQCRGKCSKCNAPGCMDSIDLDKAVRWVKKVESIT